MYRHLRNEGQEYKPVHIKRSIVEGGGVTEKGKGGRICLMFFLHIFKYGTLKLIEVILRKGMG
jgi:hypothetical protein